ncbi:hypothetical protein CA85_24840 [Allorhodopirellula solitaria]|uniref:Uncharacterized protein n=1 Tax=Allorhodopirellula solitaria TaxID=2527987 RepID=A0A5C5XTX4_9BACT|nr:hypothetical protein CA85_24840 [Allorhodopirellula solitaria]
MFARLYSGTSLFCLPCRPADVPASGQVNSLNFAILAIDPAKRYPMDRVSLDVDKAEEPCQLLRGSIRQGCSLVAAIGTLVSLISWTGCSSMQSTGMTQSYGFAYVSSTSSIWATNSASASGGMTQYCILRLFMPFFKRSAKCRMADRINDPQLNDLAGKQSQ